MWMLEIWGADAWFGGRMYGVVRDAVVKFCFADKLPPKYPHPTDSEVATFLNSVGAPDSLTVVQVRAVRWLSVGRGSGRLLWYSECVDLVDLFFWVGG